MQGSRRSPVAKLPQEARKKLEKSSLTMFFGHGVPGRIVGMRVDALKPVNFSNQIILSGSCYSGVGTATDCAMAGPVAGSLDPKLKRFSLTMVDRGAVSVFCHMRLNMGFDQVKDLFRVLVGHQAAGDLGAGLGGQHGLGPCPLPA